MSYLLLNSLITSLRSSRRKIGVIDDPLGQTHSLNSSDHGFRLKFVLFCWILKSGDGRTDNMCENNYHYRPWLWFGRVDQKGLLTLGTEKVTLLCSRFQIFHFAKIRVPVVLDTLTHQTRPNNWSLVLHVVSVLSSVRTDNENTVQHLNENTVQCYMDDGGLVGHFEFVRHISFPLSSSFKSLFLSSSFGVSPLLKFSEKRNPWKVKISFQWQKSWNKKKKKVFFPMESLL